VSVDPTAFRRLMARWATGVTVVTAHENRQDFGLTVNAFLSVSLTPPAVLISLGLDTETTPVVERTRRFAVNLLAEGQREVSARFASTIPSPEKFRSLPIRRGAGDVPLLEGAIAHFECEVRASWRVSDHLVFVADVVSEESGPDEPPLLYYHSDYTAVDPKGRERVARPTL
jgi:flavin reductase (DIM6/NTAB) family NADH-FMN oxidoreductase RutF